MVCWGSGQANAVTRQATGAGWILRVALHACVAAGMRNAKEIKMGSANQMERFLAVLDDYLQHNQSRLEVRSGMLTLHAALLGPALYNSQQMHLHRRGPMPRALVPLRI